MSNNIMPVYADRIPETVAKHEERLTAFEKRLEKNEDISMQIHQLTSVVSGLTSEIKTSNDRVEQFIISNNDRINKLEELNNEGFKTHGERMGALEQRGAKKFEAIIATVITVIITAIVMYFTRFFGM